MTSLLTSLTTSDKFQDGTSFYSTNETTEVTSGFSADPRSYQENSSWNGLLAWQRSLTVSQEENRLKAKALREQSIARQSAESQPARTPAGFLVTEDIAVAGRKRAHGSISTSVPESSRDARNVPTKDEGIQPARKFKKYVDHDFSKMTDTKGGFLSAEDDPWNKALHAPDNSGEKKPAHMTLKEWERLQLLKSLRARKEGGLEPSLEFGAKQGKRCRECKSMEIDWQWEEVFGCSVCGKCKEKFPDKYSLLTKTEAKDDYLLTDRKSLFKL
jgi:DNA-repair protein complementing XP-A cells